MQVLKRFLRLSKQERLLALQAGLAIFLIRWGLALLPLPAVHRLALKITWIRDNSPSPARIVRAVRSVARFVPGSTCLVQAIAVQALLFRHGYRPILTIGVTKSACDQFTAHAWVACEREVLIGGREAANYTALLNLGS